MTPPRVEEANQRSPSVEGKLLYARDGHIWLRTGTTAHRLTEGMFATQPCWSPDGQRIAFVVMNEGYSDIWVMEADGGNPHPVTDNRSTAPEYSRDYVHSSYWAFQPQWVPPEGELISYISHGYPGGFSSNLQIWYINADGSGQDRYLRLERHIENPTWSPDGRLLAFTYFSYLEGAQLRYFDSASNVVLALGEDSEEIERYDPAWSPDGLWIAYAARDRQTQQTDLWVMPSPLHPIFSSEWSPVRLTEQGTARGPAWSPNGQQIAFIAEEDDSFDLWLLDLSLVPGQFPQPDEAEKLTSEAHVDATARPSWAP